jgi:hypothetical protein
MICQISAFLGPLLQAGVQVGQQFLNREFGRDARRAEKDLIKAQARAGGSGSFVQSQSTGTFSAPFVPAATPVAMRGQVGLRPSPAPFRFGDMRGPLNPFVNGTSRIVGPALNGGGAVEGFPQAGRFVLDKESGCLRQKLKGEKGRTFRIDPETGDFVQVKARRMNPLNPRAAKRAARRIDATLNACKQIVKISRKKDKGVSAGDGKVVSFRTRRKKARA